jgi:hypothetical protein
VHNLYFIYQEKEKQEVSFLKDINTNQGDNSSADNQLVQPQNCVAGWFTGLVKPLMEVY